MQGLLAEVNLDPKRLEMYNLSAAMGTRWAEICTNFTDRIKNLGPSPIRVKLEEKSREPEPA